MFLMKQNIVKLVKLQGGTPQTKSGDWFSRQTARENAYETKYNKSKTTSSSPSRVEKREEKSGGGFLGGVLSIIGGVTSAFGVLLTTLAVAGTLLSSFGSILARILGWLVKSPLGVLLGLGAFMSVKSPMSNSNDVETGGGSSMMNDIIKSDTTKTVVDTAAGIGGTLAAAGAVSGVAKGVGAAKATGTAILDARTMSVGQLANSKQTTTWGKFLAFIAKKSPNLWGRVGLKLAQASVLATIPIVGWIGAAIQLGFSLWAAWEIYELWKEFNKMRDETETTTTPEQVSTPNVNRNNGGFKLDSGNTPDYYKMMGVTPPTGTLPTPMSSSSVPTLQQIGQAESGKMGYDAANNGRAGDMPNGMPGLSSKKVGEVMKLQSDKPRRLFAAGKYQIIPTTLAGLVNKGVVSVDDTFNEKTQDKLGQALYDKRIANAGNDPMKQQFELSKEFAAVANPYTGISYYAGKGNNKASLGMIQTNNGSQLNQSSNAMLNSRNAGSSSPIVFAPNTTNNNVGGNNGGTLSLPSSGVTDIEFSKLLVERAIG
jgi:hypothetical protein